MDKNEIDRFRDFCSKCTNKELMNLYNISSSTLLSWKRKYSCLSKKGRPKKDIK